MTGFSTVLKMNLKLLLRNKGYLAFLIILPIVSVIMLNLNLSDTMFEQDNSTVIQELTDENKNMLNMTNNKMGVMVYDCSNSKLSEYVIKELAKTGSYNINRYRAKTMDIKEAREKAVYIANHNVLGAIIYIPDTFEKEILQGKESNLIVMEATKDGRIDLLESNTNTYLQCLYHYVSLSGSDKESLYDLLNTSMENEVSKKTVSIEVGDTLNLSTEQRGQSSNIGYSLAFLTISFLFSGVFIAATVIEEKRNRAYNRFVLSTSSLTGYGLAKLLLVFISVVIETGIIAVAIKLLVRANFGISFFNYLFLVFCLGLIFNLLSVVIGVVINNVLSANYVAFIVWTMSCLLAGLYFPLDGTSQWWAKVSMLMPQHWVLKASEMIMAGKSGVYEMFLLVFAGYMIVILSVGILGIKISRKE